MTGKLDTDPMAGFPKRNQNLSSRMEVFLKHQIVWIFVCCVLFFLMPCACAKQSSASRDSDTILIDFLTVMADDYCQSANVPSPGIECDIESCIAEQYPALLQYMESEGYSLENPLESFSAFLNYNDIQSDAVYNVWEKLADADENDELFDYIVRSEIKYPAGALLAASGQDVIGMACMDLFTTPYSLDIPYAGAARINFIRDSIFVAIRLNPEESLVAVSDILKDVDALPGTDAAAYFNVGMLLRQCGYLCGDELSNNGIGSACETFKSSLYSVAESSDDVNWYIRFICFGVISEIGGIEDAERLTSIAADDSIAEDIRLAGLINIPKALTRLMGFRITSFTEIPYRQFSEENMQPDALGFPIQRGSAAELDYCLYMLRWSGEENRMRILDYVLGSIDYIQCSPRDDSSFNVMFPQSSFGSLNSIIEEQISVIQDAGLTDAFARALTDLKSRCEGDSEIISDSLALLE